MRRVCAVAGRRQFASGTSAPVPATKPFPTVDFTNFKEAYASKSTADLVRTLLIFKACGFKPLVQHSDRLLKLGRKVVGDALVFGVVKRTFFAHFCAGETEKDIFPRVEFLRKYGIGGILDYAAEADVAEPVSGAPAKAAVQANSSLPPGYTVEDEIACDGNLRIFHDCIQTVHNVTPEGFAAIKVTALCSPKLLERFATCLVELRTFWASLAQDGATSLSRDQFIAGHKQRCEQRNQAWTEADAARVGAWFDKLDTDKSGSVDVVEWSSALDMAMLYELLIAPQTAASSWLLGDAALSAGEVDLLKKMADRMESLGSAAAEKQVRLMVDAEQTYFQPAIDYMVLTMQRRYNTEFPSIFNTYQCYLKDSTARLELDLQRAEKEGFWFGAKLVRGAYMVSERERAAQQGYPSPIHDTLENTHACYHGNLDKVLAFIQRTKRANVMVASHNQGTIEKTIANMKTQNMEPASGGVYFGQLLGMSDHLTFTLGQNGFKAYKYVPYGPVPEVVPYLLRRAQENSDIMGGVGKERKMLWGELKRRLGLSSNEKI